MESLESAWRLWRNAIAFIARRFVAIGIFLVYQRASREDKARS